MHKLLHFLISKTFIVGIILFLQFLFLLWVILTLSDYFVFVYIFLILLSLIISVYVINKNENPSYKLAWVFVILLFPLVGGVIYLMFGGQKMPKELLKQNLNAHNELAKIIMKDVPIVELEDLDANKQSTYIYKSSHFPLYEHTETKFLPTGEVKFEVLLEELKKAEKYIFMEYFIIMEGVMWNTILDILVEKVKQGVDVRVMYDDAGCLATLPHNYDKYLQTLGIKAKVFNPMRPLLAVQLNNRDHRKIVVIDGVVGFTGGINLSDEYINVRKIHGHWKDSSVMLKGAAVFSLLAMFIQFWNFDEEQKESIFDYYVGADVLKQYKNDGFVQPFADAPTDGELVGENSHINLINNAKRYVYIQTPYLIIDNEMRTALTLAAKSGVDVRIIVPHIADKKFVYEMTKSNFGPLLAQGVRIYEYTPGFIHAKTLVSDDDTCIIGTINFDYRSYFLHFECAAWFYKSSCVKELHDDFLHTLSVSHEISYDEIKNVSVLRKVLWAILNLFAPLA